MKRALILAVGCALLAGPGYAWAQSPPPGPDRDGGRMAWRDGGWDRDGREGWRRDDRDRDDRRAYRDDDPRGTDEGWHHGRNEGHHRRGAQFWLRSGETRLGVRCDPNEPMRACVDAATTLLDKARSLPTSGANVTPPSGPGAGAPTTR